jgi:hypothetical protein
MAQGRSRPRGLARPHRLSHRRSSWRKPIRRAGAGCAPGSAARPPSNSPIPSAPAQRDYANNRRETTGSYTKSFPSVHLTHDCHAQSQDAAQLVDELRPAGALQSASQRDRERDEPDRHRQQPRPTAADGEKLGLHPRLLLRARLATSPSAGSRRRSRTSSSAASSPARLVAAPTTVTTANTRASTGSPPPTPARPIVTGLGVQLPAAVHLPAGTSEGTLRLRQLHRSSTPTATSAAREPAPTKWPASSQGRQRQPELAPSRFQHARALQLHRRAHHQLLGHQPRI